MELRTIFKLNEDDYFEKVEMSDLRDGDYFKMFEPSNEPVTDEHGRNLFRVVGNPTRNEHGIWLVNVEDVIVEN